MITSILTGLKFTTALLANLLADFAQAEVLLGSGLAVGGFIVAAAPASSNIARIGGSIVSFGGAVLVAAPKVAAFMSGAEDELSKIILRFKPAVVTPGTPAPLITPSPLTDLPAA